MTTTEEYMATQVKGSNPLERHLNEVVSKTWNFAGRCNTFDQHLDNSILGLAGEAGEVADQLKKYLYHTEKGLDFHLPKFKSELGDVCFYLAKTLELLGLSLEDVLEGNRQKLASRHPELGEVTERFGPGYIQ